MGRVLKMPVMLIVVALLAGCATLGPQYTPDTEAPKDKAIVYVYRESSVFGGGLVYQVHAKGVPVSPLPSGGYFVYYATPGEVEFSAKTEARTSVTIDAKMGEVYYVKGTVSFGVFVGHPHLTLVSQDVGAKEIAGCRLVPASSSTRIPAEFGKIAIPADDGPVSTYPKVDWWPNNDAAKLMSIANATAKGAYSTATVYLSDKALTVQILSGNGVPTGDALRIPYVDIALVELRSHVAWRGVVVTRRDGHVDTFTVVDENSVNQEGTEGAAALLRSKVQAASNASTVPPGSPPQSRPSR